MRVLILGGGTIGATVARQLSLEHSVTVVDSDPEVLHQLDSEMDIGVVHGSASQSSVLFQAGAPSANICLALTGVDEINLIGASLAHAMGTHRVAARVYANIFRDLSTFDYRHHFGIDRMFSTEYLTALELACQIREPGAMLIANFAGGEIEMQDVLISKSSPLLGVELGKLKMSSEVRIGTISRDGKNVIASASDTIELGDRISLIGTRTAVEAMKKNLFVQSFQKQRVVIAGGGEVGYHLAQILEVRDYKLTLFEKDRQRCDFLANQLKKTLVCFGDASQKSVLEEMNVGEPDIFVACLGDDENNIMACVEAQELGSKTQIAVIDRPDYTALTGRLNITKAISPQEIISRQVKGFMHLGPLVFQNSHILSGDIDVAEFEVGNGSVLTRNELKDCGLPPKVLIIALIHANSVIVPNANTRMVAGDTVIAATHVSAIPVLEELFAADPTTKSPSESGTSN